VNRKTTLKEEISSSQPGSIMNDFLLIKRLVDEHYNIKQGVNKDEYNSNTNNRR